MDRRCVCLINKLLKCSNAVPHTGSVLLPVCVMSLRGMVTQTDVLSHTENSRATHTQPALRLQPLPNGSPPGSVLCSVNAHESHQFISNTSADAAGAHGRTRQGVAGATLTGATMGAGCVVKVGSRCYTSPVKVFTSMQGVCHTQASLLV